MSYRAHALFCLWIATAGGGCGDDESRAEAGETTPPPPATTTAPGTTTTTDTGDAGSSTTGPALSGCDCAAGEYCAAPHQSGVIDPEDERLVFGCRAECVPVEDPSLWCRQDVPSCCAGLQCDDHGFCVDPNAVDTSTGSSGSGSGSTTGGTEGGSSSGSSSDSGSESSGSGASSSSG